MVRSTVRRAHKRHRCSHCLESIQPGERYVEAVCSPNHDDLGNTQWWRLAKCEDCAVLHGQLEKSAEVA